MRAFFSIALVASLAAFAGRPCRADEPPAPRAEAPRPTTAIAALDRASAAYDYGDMNQVVDAARPIVDGALPATTGQRIQALKLLGIGLYLTGRPTGAETAFLELLRVQPKSRLDPMTTRPEVVAFFEDLRRSHRAELESAAKTRKSVLWNFLPPVGQFKNGDNGRGYLLLAVEGVSFASALATRLVLGSWRQADGTFNQPCPESALPTQCTPNDRTATANTLKTWNHIAVGVLAASWAAGVIDAFVRADRDPEEHEASVSLFMFPGGGGLRATF